MAKNNMIFKIKKTFVIILCLVFYINLYNAQTNTQLSNLKVLKGKKVLKNPSEETISLQLVLGNNTKMKLDSSYKINIVNKSNGITKNTLLTNNTVLSLNFDCNYLISISGKNCSTKLISINTICPYYKWDIIIEISLSGNPNKTIDAGGLYFDEKQNTFIKYNKDMPSLSPKIKH